MKQGLIYSHCSSATVPDFKKEHSEAQQWHRFIYYNQNIVMKPDQTNEQQSNDLTDPYQNGQSEPEKLMRRHLQTPGDVISDEELKTMRIGTEDMAAGTSAPVTEEEQQEDDKAVTPWDVIDP